MRRNNWNLHILTILLLVSIQSTAQNRKKLIKGEIQPGQFVPDFKFETIIDFRGNNENTIEGNTKLSEFKGKLIIFDFWTTNCTSCIEHFPELSALQSKFEKDIIILLVNTLQDEQEIKNWIKSNIQRNPEKNIIPKNLKIIVDKDLANYFPLRTSIGYHVWIGKDQKVILRGIPVNTNERKVLDYLDGKDIFFIEDQKTREIKSNSSFFAKDNTNFDYCSTIGGFQEKDANPYGEVIENIKNNRNATIRSTYLNRSISDLYTFALQDELNSDTSILFTASFLPNIVLLVNDTSQVTIRKKYLNAEEITDRLYRKSLFSYEQISSIKYSSQLRRKLMYSDLNNYFRLNFKIVGSIVPQLIPCYKVVKSNSVLIHKSDRTTSKIEIKENMIEFSGMTLREILHEYFLGCRKIFKNESDVVIMGFNDSEKYDLKLPLQRLFEDLTQLNAILAQFGLKIIKSNDFVNQITIQDV